MKVAAASLLLSCLASSALAAVRPSEQTPECLEVKALAHKMGEFVVSHLFDYDAQNLPRATKQCVEETTTQVIDYAFHFVKDYCEKAVNPIGIRMCENAKENPKFATGRMLYHIKPGKIAAAYCAGKLDVAGPIPMNKLLFNESNVFDTLEVQQEFIYTIHDDEQSCETMENLRGISDCTTCVVEANIAGIDYLYRKWEEICEHNYDLGDHNNELIEFKCRLLSFDPEISRGALYQKYSVKNWTAGFCLGSGACSHKGDNLLAMKEFFGAYNKNFKAQKHAQQIEQAKPIQQVQQHQ